MEISISGWPGLKLAPFSKLPFYFTFLFLLLTFFMILVRYPGDLLVKEAIIVS